MMLWFSIITAVITGWGGAEARVGSYVNFASKVVISASGKAVPYLIAGR